MATWTAARLRSGRLARRLAIPVAGALFATLLTALPPAANAGATLAPLTPREERPVPVTVVPTRPRPADPAAAPARLATPPVAWPDAAAAEVDLASAGLASAARSVAAGGLPVRVAAVKGVPAAAGKAVARVRVELLGRAEALRAGVDGLLLRVARGDGGTGTGRVSLEVDYTAFRHAYGGDWASRLRLARLPGCALSTPEEPACRTPEAVPTRNDVLAGTVAAEVDASATAQLYAVIAAASGSTGTYTATSLAPSASWQVSTQSGQFSWSYPLRVPPSIGGPAPQVGFSYSSGSVDGRTVSTNNQPSWLGEGFQFWPGYIERQYKACAEDGVTPKPGDQCWGGDHASMVLGGISGPLIKDSATGVWHPEDDDGSRVELLTGATNGDNNGEYWRVTTQDGTQYFFGRNRLPGWGGTSDPVTRSTWTMPVFGDDPGEPCNGATFATSWCDQAWRWNLDYVVDPHGNVMSYWYEPETNYYGRNLQAADETAYHRGGYLVRAQYGQRDGAVYSSTAPARVQFTVAERCLPTSTFDCAESKFTSANASHWPDVPYDQKCDAGASCTNFSPSFWTRKRLTKVTTQVWGGAAYRDVDSWALTHTFPATGDGTSKALWLEAIQHTGHVGGTSTLPAVDFDGVELENRVDALEGIAPMFKWRVAVVNSEAGGRTDLTYSLKECTRANPPTPDANAKRCFPQYWTPEGSIDPIQDWFHKYVVTQVVDIDATGPPGTPFEVTRYSYLDGAAWHYDDQELTPSKHRTWSEWRGYGRVRVTRGEPSEQQSQSEQLFFRGMDGDRLSGGGTRSVGVTDSEGVKVADHDALAGVERESIVYNGPGGPVVSGRITDPWRHGPTSARGEKKAYIVDTAKVRNRVALATGGWHRTELRNDFETTYGNLTQVNDLGDVTTTADDRCTTNTYVRNTGAWLIQFKSRVEAVSVACGVTPSRPADVLMDVRTYFDGSTNPVTAPTRGDVTKVEELGSWSGGPVYVTVARNLYDVHGRVTESYDAAGNKTTTAYTPVTGGPVTGSSLTNPLNHVTSTVLEPAWGTPVTEIDENNKRTDLAYDPLGRLLKVWLPGRSKSGGQTPNLEFAYLVRNTGPVAVTTRSLRNDGSYTSGVALYDSRLRPRQNQSPAVGGGRLLTETQYDTRGLVAKTNDSYYNDQPPGTELVTAADNVVPAQTVLIYDGVERQTDSSFHVLGVQKWHTTTTYGGDRVDMDPPDGATPTTTVFDALGRTIQLRQYKGASPTGDYDATTYAYTKGGQLETVTDTAGNVWRNHYDLRGRRFKTEDPDKGTTVLTFNDLGQVTTSTDARDRVLAFAYDALGRKTAMHEGSLAGAQLAGWTYDTLAKGHPTSSTRYVGGVGGAAYTSAVTGYDNLYRPTGTSVTIPAAEGTLAGTYASATAYNLDGTVDTTTYPAAGPLAAETVKFTYNELGMPLTAQSTDTTLPSRTYVGETIYTRYGQLEQLRMGIPGFRVTRQFFHEEGTRRLSRAITDRELPVPTGVRQADVNYTYDAAGNLTRIADTPPPADAPSDTQCFRYDHLRRLTEAWAATDACAANPSLSVLGGPAPYWHSHTYDAVGNRQTEVQHASTGDTTRTYTYPAAGQPRPHTLTSVDQQGPSGSRLDEYGYDATGNTTARTIGAKAQVLDWDAEGRLAKVTEGTKVTSFLYDADGNRLIRRDPTATTLYLGATEVRREIPTGVIKATRYYDVGGTIAVRTYDKKVTWMVDDHQGTAQLAIDAGTMAVTRRRFTPFGAIRGTAPIWKGERGFVDGTIDAAIGLTSLGAREYEATTGRFLSVDQIIDVADPQQMHGYAYANNSPVTFRDPDGLRYCDPQDGNVAPPGGKCNGNRDSEKEEDKGNTAPPSNPPNNPGGNNGGGDSGGGGIGGWFKKRAAAVSGWVRDNRAEIVGFVAGTVVGVGCGIAIGWTGAGAVACAVAGGAIGSMVTNALDSSADHSVGGYLKAGAIGAIGGLVGLGAGAALGAAIKAAAPAIGQAIKAGTAALGRAAPAVAQAVRATGKAVGSRSSSAVARVAQAVRKVAGCNSFAASTLVLMADGSRKAIKNVKIGDKVLATDPGTGRTESRPVTDVIVGHGQKQLVEITVATHDAKHGANNTINATEAHPFWVADHARWLDAGELERGDLLRTSAGTYVQVGAIRKHVQLLTVYNLTVDGIHTYYVGAADQSVLVHNAKCPVRDTHNAYPSNNGFEGPAVTIRPSPGYRFDRYGHSDPALDRGRFVSPEGTPFEMRSLPRSARNRPLNTYEVVAPFDTEVGLVRPFYGQPGGGMQIRLPAGIVDMIRDGLIKVS